MKKTMAMLLALLLVAVMLPVTAMADVVEVSTEEDLRTAVATGGEIKLTGDIAITGDTIVVSGGQSVKIDLNEHTISRSEKPFSLKHGSLEFTGEGTVKENNNNGYSPVLIKGSTNANDTNYSVLTVGKDVTFAGWAPIFVDHNNQKAYGVVVNFNGKAVSPADESHTAYGCAAYINGQTQHKNNCPIINIGSTAELKSKDVGIYAAGYGIWNIEGEVIGTTGIYAKGGVINLNGAGVYANGNYAEPRPNGNGCDSTGAAIALDSKTGYAGGIELKVSGDSEISSNFGHALEIFSTDNPETNVIDVNIGGGRFAGSSEKGAVSFDSIFTEAANKSGTNVTAKITGGSFNFAYGETETGKALLKKYIPSNMDIEDEGDNFGGVISKTITIIVPSEGGNTTTTPSTDNTKNPSTGANDFVGVAAALAVVSVLGAAVAVRKK